MKTKTTKRDIMSRYKHVIKVGNGKLQETLKYESPEFYTEGKYGWNADIYTHPDYPDACICIGDRPFGNCEYPKQFLELCEVTVRLSDIDEDSEIYHKELVRSLFDVTEEEKNVWT